MPGSRVFSRQYQKLNPEQKRAVDTIEGPVMVVAGPGTGKTQILTLRIANILRKTDTPPECILALTFTEAGVTAMRKRLVEIMGSEAYRVGIYTFHGFANDLINRFPGEYPRIIGSKHITDIDKITLLREIIKITKLRYLKPFGAPFYYVDAIRSAISELKRENITPVRAEERVRNARESYKKISDLYYTTGSHKGEIRGKYKQKEKQIEKDRELALLYRRYEKALQDQKLYDYEDMIVETIRALEKNKDFLLTLEEQYHYILADEHQDANTSQNHLLELLASFHESPNLFLVGDEKQAIYRFQGASLENFLYFSKQFKKASIIKLDKNYRSLQDILNAAHTLIRKSPLSPFESKKPLSAERKGASAPLNVLSFSRPEFEYAYIAADIKQLIEEGVEPSEIAILYRNNHDVEALTPALEREGVPFVIESDQNVLQDLDIQKFLKLLSAVDLFGNEEKFTPILFIDFLDLTPLEVYRLLRFRTRERIALFDLLRSKALMKKAGIQNTKKIEELFHKCSSWSAFAKNHGLLDTLECIAKESGFWAHIIAHPQGEEKLDKYAGFIRDIEQLVEVHREYQLHDLLQYLNLLTEHGLLVRRARRYARTPSVRLMTAHKSKGLEFEYVYLPQVVLGHWGNKRTITHFSIATAVHDIDHDPLDDERRLFYVALTRARLGATISYAKEGLDGKEQLPSQFVEEIDKKFLSYINVAPFERTQKTDTLLAPRTPSALPVTSARYLRELFLEQGLSVTALNNYLRDPWEYFFGNLLRVPKAPTKSMLFGTAIHGALNDFFEKVREGEKTNKAYLLSHFRDHLSRQPLSEYDYDESLKKGEYALSSYYQAHNLNKEYPVEVVGNEFSIILQFPIGNGIHIPIRGIVDKIEQLSGNNVRIVDYKTGPVRSRNDILGKTKNSTGDYFRQLVFYKLLLSEYQKGLYTMTSGVIDFVEPDTRGRHRREEFSVTDDDVEELRELISKSAQDILELSFWETPCNPKKSNFCDLWKIVAESKKTVKK